MEKVVTVLIRHVIERETSTPLQVVEHESPVLKGYLDQGYTVKEVHQLAPQGAYIVLTFILTKRAGTSVA